MNNTMNIDSLAQDSNQGKKAALRFEAKEVATIIAMYTVAAATVVLTGLSWAA
ncbi:hypothetical protein VISI1226_06458 [Vibrio sinaloensis DSM 21326]|uniref:Uncharacterized protein n=1 Tax=Vibrio sinaloensis DSM 21326 TaxID=945550 RepID=E8M4A4_PHOS4|nr:hypothetical protein [Vibrio sinaloensis]EGA71142.1 hypothetical protein VISI1226_06458 [Vibrio sinaloensis DSM 21326]MDN3685407.1 hypothetical protein [Vibrio sinaloensis]